MQTLKVYKPSMNKTKVLNVYTVAAASSILGISLKSVYKWIEQGRLQMVSIAGGDITLVDGKSIDAALKMMEFTPRRGRKQKERD